MGRQGAVREYARPAATGWVALVGEFAKPGAYEVAGEAVAIPDLLRRCEGLTKGATKTLRVVRNGRSATAVPPGSEAATLLRPGDVLVAEGNAERRFGVTAVGYEDRARQAAQRANVQLGVVGLKDHPVTVQVPGTWATVDGLLVAANQRHLQPKDVTVVLGGSQKLRGDQLVELTSGSVVVFDPKLVSRPAAEASTLQTNYYPVLAPPSALPAEMSTETPSEPAPPIAPSGMIAAPGAESQVVPLRTDVAPPEGSFAALPPQMSQMPPAPPTDDLSALPEVESLDPPADEPPLGFGRVADASGAVPIGRPDVAESHITAVPADSFYGPAETRVAMADPAPTPPMGPTDSLGPATSLGPADSVGLMAEEPIAEEPLSLGSLAATILAGGALGVVTFLILRKLRGRRLLKLASTRLRAKVARPVAVAVIEEPPIVAARTSPNDLLAALVANRMAFREEAVELPAALRIFGRSSAQKKRRIDPPAAGVPEPHIPLAAPAGSEAAEAKAVAGHSASKPNLRIDPAEPASQPVPGLAGGTPFERALAARQRTGGRLR